VEHGPVAPLYVYGVPTPEKLRQVAERAAVPLWLPHPAPGGWLVTGLATAGDERTGARATVLALSGPAPLGGAGECVLVAEEPGLGLGAHYAGLAGPDPGDGFDDGPPHAKVEAAGHPTALWALPGAPDRAVYAGEAKGNWLWAVLWPADAGVLLVEDILLADLRERPVLADECGFGACSPRLVPPAPAR
jgi:hypothetical protein